MSELHDKQVLFARLLPRLLDKAFDLGYEVRVGEVLRAQAQADANALAGTGISHSVHMQSLAADIDLFKNGVYIIDSTGHSDLGAFWKTLNPDCRWGGDFIHLKDYDHYSITYQGYS